MDAALAAAWSAIIAVLFASGAAAQPVPQVAPADRPCPKCERIFDGRTWAGWEHDPADWTIVDGAMRGFGPGARSAFTVADYGSFRLIVTSRMSPVNQDHLGVLFWGLRPARGSLAFTKNIQVQPPHAAMWDYYENHALERQMLASGSRNYEAWNTIEILANLDKGTLRVAVDGREIMRYADRDPARLTRGPIGMQKHGAGGSEYKDIFVEADPTEDVLYTALAPSAAPRDDASAIQRRHRTPERAP